MKKEKLKKLKDLKNLQPKKDENKYFNKSGISKKTLNSEIMEELHKMNDTSEFFEEKDPEAK